MVSAALYEQAQRRLTKAQEAKRNAGKRHALMTDPEQIRTRDLGSGYEATPGSWVLTFVKDRNIVPTFS
jgi:hypothetical protein